MPTMVLRGKKGSGKSWLLCRFAQEIAERRIPCVVLDSTLKATRLPGAFEYISHDIDSRFGIKTPRFAKVYEVYAKRFLGIAPFEKQAETGIFKEFFKSFRRESEEENPLPNAVRKLYGDDWERILPSRPIYEHLRALALSLSEDIDSSLQRKKYPFIALLIDDWDTRMDRFYPHWADLFEPTSRLLTVVATSSDGLFGEVFEIPVIPFDEAEARAALRRRGIEANHAVAGIISESGGNPAVISLASSLAELISRSGDIIKSDTFARKENTPYTNGLLTAIVERLRDSELEALFISLRAGGLDISALCELFPEEPNLVENIVSVLSIFPFEPVYSKSSPIEIFKGLQNRFEFMPEIKNLPGERNILGRCDSLAQTSENGQFEFLSTRIKVKLDSQNGLCEAIEKIIHYYNTGQIGPAEDIWFAAKPPAELRGLASLHHDIGDILLEKILPPESRLKYFDKLEFDLPEAEGRRRIAYARALSDKGRKEAALDELRDTVSLLSSAITESSGAEPALWLVRGDALCLASELMFPAGAYRDALSAAEKSADSFKRARDGGLECAGLVSLKTARAFVSAASALKTLGETRTAMTWLERARENLATASEQRKKPLPDIALLSAKILAMKGEIFEMREQFDPAEEFLEAALSEIDTIEGIIDVSNPGIILFRAKIFTSLAGLMFRSGSEDSAFEFIKKTHVTFDKYEDTIGGPDADSLIGRGKAQLLKSEMLSVENTPSAISAARDSEGYFKRAISIQPSDEAIFGRIDALISIAELLSGEERPDEAIFEEIEKILSEKAERDGIGVPILERKIKLFRVQGSTLYRKGKYTSGARFFSAAVKLYSELHSLSPDIPFASEVGELQLALSVSLQKAGDHIEAFTCLQRAEEAFETAADDKTREGLKRILHSSIAIYNELASTGKDEEAFEIALFIIELSAKVGGPEVLEVGQMLLTFWESQELTSREKRRLDSSAGPLRELWGGV